MQKLRLRIAQPEDRPALREFLLHITLLGDDLISPRSRYWILESGQTILASAGLEFGAQDAIMRSVAVLPELRNRSWGQQLMWLALHHAQQQSYRYCYCFSTRAGAYWQRFGFNNVPIPELAANLADTPQVQRFAAIGKLDTEVAWRFDLQAHTIPSEKYAELVAYMS